MVNPFEEGMKAYREYVDRGSCPYKPLTRDWHDWQAGYSYEKNKW